MTTTGALQEQWGKRIRAARRHAGLSLQGLSELTGINKAQLSRVENGIGGLIDENRIRVSSALGRRVEDLFPYPDTTGLISDSEDCS